MTVTVQQPFGSRIGPGFRTQAHTDQVAIWGSAEVRVIDPVTSSLVVSGTQASTGGPDLVVILGWDEQFAQYFKPTIGLIDGAAVNVLWQFLDPSNAVIDQLLQVGVWGFDPTTSPWTLLQFVTGGLTPAQQLELDAIRDAVISNASNMP